MLKLEITMDQAGQINVSGSPEVIGNKVLSLGLLAVGAEILRETWKASERRVQPASPLDLSALSKQHS